jgi:hypothetical protein
MVRSTTLFIMSNQTIKQAGERTHKSGCLGAHDYRDCTCGAYTITQSEGLKVGQRGEYILRPAKSRARAERLGITCWVDKRKSTRSLADRTLSGLLDDFAAYELVYGLTYKGKDHETGDMPRDLASVIQGIEIAENEA